MTTDELMAQVMARRTAQGLVLRLLTPDGVSVLYPKDHATKARWEAAAVRKGYTILASEEESRHGDTTEHHAHD
jgi:hypothetical protein